MIPQPSVLPVWAILDLVDPTSGQNNVTTPPTEQQNYGWAFEQQPPRNWFNWLGRNTYTNLAYAKQQLNQQITTTDNTGSTPIVNVTFGGMALIYVIDTTTPANYFFGIAYIPASPSGAITVTTISSSTLTVSTISVTGTMTVIGGSGNFIINGQMALVPA